MSSEKQSESLGDTIRTVVYAVVIAMGVRIFAYEPFNIPSGSMIPTLLVGDYLFVSKYSYGYSRYSFPLGLPLISGRVFFDPPKRGDVAVFKLPQDQKTDYIKRIIGLPGDHVQVRDGRLYVNGMLIEREADGEFTLEGHFGTLSRLSRYRETLSDGVSYDIIETSDHAVMDNTQEYIVPEGHYFAMGDNRDNSLDSRVAAGVGFIPEENLVGRAEMIFFSHDGRARFWEFWKWPFAIRYSRLFTAIR